MMLSAAACGSLPPHGALQPPLASGGVAALIAGSQPGGGPSAPYAAQWALRQGGLNCYDGHGAPGASGSPVATDIRLDECKQACLDLPGCQAIVVKHYSATADGAVGQFVSCYVRETVYPEKCIRGTDDFELYILTPVPPASPPSPASPSPSPASPKEVTLDNCVGAECAGLGAGAGQPMKAERKHYSCIAIAAHCMPCGEPIPAIGGCNKNYDQSDCQAEQCEWLGEFGPGCEMGESTESGVGDDWCAESCNAEPPNCPAEKCECEGGNPMILNAGVERPTGLTKEANEIWTENQEKKQFSEREAVAKKMEKKREEREKETAAREAARNAEIEKARQAKEEVTSAKAEAERKEREDGVIARNTQAAEHNRQAMEMNKAAADNMAKSADEMTKSAEQETSRPDEARDAAEAMRKEQAEDMKKKQDEMVKQREDMKKQADAAAAAQPQVAASLPTPLPVAEAADTDPSRSRLEGPGTDAAPEAPGTDAAPEAPGTDANSEAPGTDANSEAPGTDADALLRPLENNPPPSKKEKKCADAAGNPTWCTENAATPQPKDAKDASGSNASCIGAGCVSPVLRPAAKINHRFREGMPSDNLNEVGLVFRQFDALEGLEKPWQACEKHCHCKLYSKPGKELNGRLSAMIAFKGLKDRTDRQAIPLPYADRAGVVLRNGQVSVQCLYGKDAATFVLDNPANPGCSDEYCNASSPIRWIWRAGKKIPKPCGFHDYHGPAYPASEMKTLLQRFADHGELWQPPGFHSGYNEIIINASRLNAHLPFAIEAFFVLNASHAELDGLGVNVSKARRDFIAQYELEPQDVPLLLLDPWNWEEPFSVLDES